MEVVSVKKDISLLPRGGGSAGGGANGNRGAGCGC